MGLRWAMVRRRTLWQRKRDLDHIEHYCCVAVMYILYFVIILLHVRNTGRQDVSMKPYMPAHCEFKASEDYKEAR
jgi:hypothetical protein